MQMEVFGWHAQKNGNSAAARLTGRRRTMLWRERRAGNRPGTGRGGRRLGRNLLVVLLVACLSAGLCLGRILMAAGGVPRRLHRPAADL